jgi:hypothetical protein
MDGKRLARGEGAPPRQLPEGWTWHPRTRHFARSDGARIYYFFLVPEMRFRLPLGEYPILLSCRLES